MRCWEKLVSSHLITALFFIHPFRSNHSSIVTRFKTGNVFTERHTNTIGVDFSMKTLKIGNKKIKLQIWVSFFFMIIAKFIRYQILKINLGHSWTWTVQKHHIQLLSVRRFKNSILSSFFILNVPGVHTGSLLFTISRSATRSYHFKNGLMKWEIIQLATLFAL